MGVADLEKLINTGWGQIVIIGGIIHVILTNKNMTRNFKLLVEKIAFLEKFVVKREILDEATNNDILRLEKKIADQEARIRELERSQVNPKL